MSVPRSGFLAVTVAFALGCTDGDGQTSAPVDGGVDGAGDVDRPAEDAASGGNPLDAAGESGPKSLVDERPYRSKVPSAYDPSKPTPLLVALHGYSVGADDQERYLGFAALADEKNFLYAYPEGTRNALGATFWNATDACCGYGSTIDDVGYLEAVIDDMASRYNVDADRIWLFGHSNGGFMAHRMACDRANRIAAIASLAGAVWKDTSRCKPSQPVAVLQIHGDADTVIRYGGGHASDITSLPEHPSAKETVATWAAINGCSGASAMTRRLDLVGDLAGDETKDEAYAGCASGSAARLWTIEGGSHIPSFSPSWRQVLYEFFAAHPKTKP